jgi:hypothetical protein
MCGATGRKAFFFEKKKQKTFIYCALADIRRRLTGRLSK